MHHKEMRFALHSSVMGYYMDK